MLLDDLANITGVTVITMDNGAARVSLDGLSLVSDVTVSPLSYDPATQKVRHSASTVVSVGGELAGFQSYLNTELPAFQTALNTLVRDLANGINAEALAALRSALVADGDTNSLDDSIRSLVSYVGEMTAASSSGARSQAAMTSTAENGRMQAHAVSIAEEMVNLITYQREYEAAARVMTAVDESLDTLINRTGVEGR